MPRYTPIRAELAPVTLPDFGMPKEQPTLAEALFTARLQRTRQAMADNNIDFLVLYADREHSANLAWLTDYDPRFEEAMLILGHTGVPTLLVGNEGLGYIPNVKIPVKTVLYQPFSLMGQDRTQSQPLAQILQTAGLSAGKRMAIAGWKYDETNPRWLEAPHYIIEALLSLQPESLINAGSLFMHPESGLRTTHEAAQLAAYEFAACHTSEAIKNVIHALQAGVANGITEFEAVQAMQLNGLPLSCHLMLSSGERALVGLNSPSAKVIRRGERFTTAYGVWGALNCRAGFLVATEAELPADAQNYIPALVAPYYQAVVRWYETIRIGIAGAEVYDAVMHEVGDPFFGVKLNPGHLIASDEWVHSPFYAGSGHKLRSGMALQMDIIPATGAPLYTTNAEDGIAIADEALRNELTTHYPAMMARVAARRGFMASLGITLAPEVLPFSNIAAWLPPLLLNPNMAMQVVR